MTSTNDWLKGTGKGARRSAMRPNSPAGLEPPERNAVWEFTAPAEVGGFAQESLRDWGLSELSSAVSAAVTAMAAWSERNEPTGRVRLGLSLHEPFRPLLYAHVTDQGTVLPDPYRKQDDAKLAVQVLGPPCIAWGASLESESDARILWTIFSTRREEAAP